MGVDLYQILDGEVWAKQFIDRVERGVIDPRNLDDVRPWFQNAIQAGRDNGKPICADQADHMLQQEDDLRKNKQ